LSRIIAGTGIVLIVLFYMLPYRGSIPIYSLFVGIVELSGHLGDATGLALLAGQTLSLGPLLFAMVALIRLRRRAPEHGGALVTLLLAFIPILCLLVGLRSIAFMAAHTLLHIRSAVVILTVVVGGCLAVSILARSAWYEIPWTFGQLTRVDQMLAAALAEQDTEATLSASLEKLNPLVRPIVRRRLRLWKSAAAEVPGAGEADLSRVMHFLEERRREERELGEEPPAIWPGWMLGIRPYVILGTAVLAFILPTWLAAHRPPVALDWVIRLDNPELDSIFTDEITEAISDLSRHREDSSDLGSISGLSASLQRAEILCPGIHDGLMDLLKLGELGRNRLHSIWRARDDLNYLLQVKGVPYFVRSRVRARRGVGGRDLFYLLTYRVVDCRQYRLVDSELEYPVLKLERADRLNVIERYVATTDEEEPYVSILLNRVGEFMDQRLLEVAEGDDLVADIVRSGLATAGMELSEFASGVKGRLGEWVVEGLTRHELHHKWLGLDPDPPASLWAWMSGYSEDSVRGVASEVGAFLGELGYQPAYARMRLALMIDAISTYPGHRGTHGRARIFLLARLFDVELGGPLAWQVQGIRLAIPKLTVMDDKEISRRIDECHQELFGVGLPRFEPVDNSSH
jgi:hypothetical protein